jgi:hypothetical protein
MSELNQTPDQQAKKQVLVITLKPQPGTTPDAVREAAAKVVEEITAMAEACGMPMDLTDLPEGT